MQKRALNKLFLSLIIKVEHRMGGVSIISGTKYAELSDIKLQTNSHAFNQFI